MANEKIASPTPVPITATVGPGSDFFRYCNIHGLKEVKRNENSPTMTFWLIVMIGCFAGVSYEIYQIVSYYQANPGVTQVSWTTQIAYKYPPMAFCPKTWLSWRRAKRLNFSENALAYVVSLVNMDVVVEDDFDEDAVRREVAAVMKTHNISDFTQLIKSISFEPHEILRVVAGPSNVTFGPILQSFGVCYLIDVEPIAATTLRTNVMLRLAYRASKGDPRLHKYDGRWQPRLLLRDSNGLKANFISFGKRAIYTIDLEAQVHTRMSRYDKLCLLDRQIPADALPTGRKEEYSAALCEFLCLEKERLRRSCDYCLNIALIAAMKLNPKQEVEPCFYYRDRSTAEATGMINDTILPESVERHEDTKSMDALLDSPQCSAKEMKAVQAACNAKCPPPCTQWLFRHSTSVVSEDLPTGEILLWIVYNPIDGIMLYEEVPTYTLDTFISNIGGQLGLWLGASIISIVQIFYYAWAVLWNKTHRRKKSADGGGKQQNQLPAGWPNGTIDSGLPPVTLTRV